MSRLISAPKTQKAASITAELQEGI